MYSLNLEGLSYIEGFLFLPFEQEFLEWKCTELVNWYLRDTQMLSLLSHFQGIFDREHRSKVLKEALLLLAGNHSETND